ncbi:BspA family leucine-rich repeat surface protein [Fodinibius sp. SL11]|uniref:BspA family leucine-rich repeat surface protein n=1 Tax=Fodinibius sp. SL11 TaxID=3425690 RepID=UPI003F88468B
MRNLLIIILAISLIGMWSCSDSGTGPDSGNDGNGGNGGDETTTYSVNVSSSEGGSVDPSGTNEYDEGEEIEIEASANDEYMFAGWTGDVESEENPLSLTVDQDYELSANFEVKNYELTINTEGEGEVAEEVVEKNKDYESGTVVELTANPANGWTFSEWTGDLSGSENPQQFTMDGAKEVTAVFSEKPKFYLADNDVTIKCEQAEVGETATLGGVTYTKRTADQITTDNAGTTCTSGIKDMSGMFGSDENFNGDISSWDVSSATDMSAMFFDATSFNRDLSSWDVSNVTNMEEMFYEAVSFNQDLSSWDVSSVTNMSSMFERNGTFNGDISSWDVSSVTDMSNMFYRAEAFNGDLSGWDVGNVIEMGDMFSEATSFNSDISNWDVSSVTDMGSMFELAASFNKDLSGWDVSSVTDMHSMFEGATIFNKDLSSWNVGNVESMSSMFKQAEDFNGFIGSWDVSKVVSMNSMFEDATSFNQDISGWCVSNFDSEPQKFSDGSPLIDDYKPEWGTCPSQ